MRRNRIVAPALVSLVLAAFGVLTTDAPSVHGQAKKDDPKKVDPKKGDAKKDNVKNTLELRDDWPKVTGTLAKVLAVDSKKGSASVQFADGKKGELTFAKDVKFMGPRGGAADIGDARLAVGRTIKVVYDAGGKTVKEVHLQVMKAGDKETEKDKAKEKEKDKEKKK